MSTLKQPVNKKSHHKHVVYKHTAPNGKSYIGITNHYIRRCRQHQKEAVCSIFHRAINKYGWENFTHEFLATGLTLESANHFEEFYIRTHATVSPNGYNLESGGKVAKSNPITTAKIAKSNTGKKRSPESKAKMSAAQKGKTHTEETKAKMSESFKGRVVSEEVRAKMSEMRKGVMMSESAKLNVAFGIKRRHFKPEYDAYLTNVAQLPKDVILTTKEMLNLFKGTCVAVTINRRIRKGEFPNAYKIKNKFKTTTTMIPITDVIAYYEKYKEIYLVDSDVELL